MAILVTSGGGHFHLRPRTSHRVFGNFLCLVSRVELIDRSIEQPWSMSIFVIAGSFNPTAVVVHVSKRGLLLVAEERVVGG